MIDKELREILNDMKIISIDHHEGITNICPTDTTDKLNAIIKYLGIKFYQVPDHLIAVKKVQE